MCPYFFLFFFFLFFLQVYNRQQIKIYNQVSAILNACVAATENASDTVILNTSNDGVLCKTKWNHTLCVGYLRSKTSQLSLYHTNNNIHNLRYQLVVASSPTSFGFYSFDNWLFKISVDGPVGSNHGNLQNPPLLALGYRALRELPRCTVQG